MTSSVFDFYAYLKLAMGITLRPLISPARNWTFFYLVYLMMAPNGEGGVTFSSACLDVGLDGCGTERREGQSSLTVGGEGETITDAARMFEPSLAQPLCVNIYQSPTSKSNEISSFSALKAPLRLTVINSHADSLSGQVLSAGNDMQSTGFLN